MYYAMSSSARLPNQRSAGDRLEHRVGDVEVRVDVLDVVEILEPVDEPQQLAGPVLVEADGVPRDESELRRLHLEPVRLERVAHGGELCPGRRHLPDLAVQRGV